MIYLLALILIFIGVYRYDYLDNRRGESLYWILLCILLISIAGFRYRLGIDSLEYSEFYHHINPINKLGVRDFLSTRFAPGFVLLTSLCKTLCDDFMLLQFIVAGIVNLSVFYFFKTNTKHCYFGLLLYFLFLYTDLNMEVIREAIAVSLFLISWQFFRNSRWFEYYVFILIAMLFHLSATVFLLLPLICLPGVKQLFTFGKRTWLIGGIVLATGFVIHHFFLDYLKLIVFTESMLDRINQYARTGLGGLETLNMMGVITSIFRLVVYPCIAMFFLNRKYNTTLPEKNSLFKVEAISLLSIYISLLSFTVFIFARFNNYLLFFSFLLISDWVFSYLDLKRKKIRLEFITWILIFLPLFAINTYTLYFSNVNRTGSLKNYMKYYPYESVFDEKKDKDRENVFHYQRR